MQPNRNYLTDSGLNRAMAGALRSRPRFQQPMQTGFGASSLPHTSGGLRPVGPANNQAPLPTGGGNPIGGIDIPPATGGNPPTTAPFPTIPNGPPTGGNYDPGQTAPGGYIGIYNDDPMPGVHTPYYPPYTPIGSNPGDNYDPNGGRFGPGGIQTDPNAPDRFGGGGGPGWGFPGTTPAGLAYARNASLGFAQGPFSEGATSVGGAGGWMYKSHSPSLQA